jgi:hypothetical protein
VDLWTTQARCPQVPQAQQQQKKRTIDVLQNADIFTRYGHWSLLAQHQERDQHRDGREADRNDNDFEPRHAGSYAMPHGLCQGCQHSILALAAVRAKALPGPGAGQWAGPELRPPPRPPFPPARLRPSAIEARCSCPRLAFVRPQFRPRRLCWQWRRSCRGLSLEGNGNLPLRRRVKRQNSI